MEGLEDMLQYFNGSPDDFGNWFDPQFDLDNSNEDFEPVSSTPQTSSTNTFPTSLSDLLDRSPLPTPKHAVTPFSPMPASSSSNKLPVQPVAPTLHPIIPDSLGALNSKPACSVIPTVSQNIPSTLVTLVTRSPSTYSSSSSSTKQVWLQPSLIKGNSLVLSTGQGSHSSNVPPICSTSQPVSMLASSTLCSQPLQAMVAGGTILLVDPERPPAAVPIASRVGHFHQAPARRSSHNAIERRYRSSINERMGELRALLAGPNSKLHKSAVLRKAVDYIRYLQEVNRRLRKQNRTLRCSLQPCAHAQCDWVHSGWRPARVQHIRGPPVDHSADTAPTFSGPDLEECPPSPYLDATMPSDERFPTFGNTYSPTNALFLPPAD
uniref:sterol regulatory element-binding protein 1-like isoform X1 n=3 Tax=Myxine glutinosa TaxID=7769 RepID=UPI00358EE44B